LAWVYFLFRLDHPPTEGEEGIVQFLQEIIEKTGLCSIIGVREEPFKFIHD
jgi:hypothetical protein